MPELPEFDDIEVVLRGRGYAQNDLVRAAFHRASRALPKMWHYHFELLMLGYGAYLVFFQFCKKAFPEIADQTVARMVAGIDVLMFRPDDELKSARAACGQVRRGMRRSCRGRRPARGAGGRSAGSGNRASAGSRSSRRSRDPWFNISTGDGFYHHHRSWNDDLSVPFSALPRYMALLRAGKSIDRPTEQLRRERAADHRRIPRAARDRRGARRRSTRCSACATWCSRSWRITSSDCEHWYTTRFYARCASSARCSPAGG